MPNLPKFEPLAGNTYTLQLKYNQPKQGNSPGGDGKQFHWYLWGVIVNSINYNWFLPNKETYDMIIRSGINNKDIATLTVVRQKGQRGAYDAFSLATDTGTEYSHEQAPQGEPPPQGTPPQEDAPPHGDSDVPQGTPATQPAQSIPASEQPIDKFDEINILMGRCLDSAIAMAYDAKKRYVATDNIPDQYLLFTSEDVRSIAISMFIQMSR